MIGDSRALPFGMPIDAWISFPFNFSSCLYGVLELLVMSRISLQMLLALVSGRIMQRVTPSNSQPSSSFHVSHIPSPCFSFLTKIESFSGLVGSGGKIACIPWRMALVACWTDAMVGAWSTHMKSSTNTSRTLLSLLAFASVIFGRFCVGGVLRYSKGCGGSVPIG